MSAERRGIIWGLLIVATIALAPSFWPRTLPDRSFGPDDRARSSLGSTPVKRVDRTLGSQHSALSFGVHRRQTGAEPSCVEATAGGFRTRAMSGIEGEAGRAWAERNRLTPPLSFSHHLAAIFPPALHTQHPEFFPLVHGERMRPRDGAHNWNPDLGHEDVAAWTAEAARRYFDAHPESESFSVGVNDGLIFGDSAETLALIRPRAGEMVQFRTHLFAQEAIRGRSESDLSIRVRSRPFSVCPRVVSCENQTISWFRQRPDFSNLVFGFTNRVARDVAQTHPGKYIGALAYYWCENAPDFPLEPNVVPFLTADRSQGYDEDFRREELALQQRWAELGRRWTGNGRRWTVDGGPGAVNEERNRRPSTVDCAPRSRRLGLYDYLYGSGFLIPRIHTRLIADSLRQARRLGFTDYFAEVNPNWGLDGPMPWLVAQLLQDPEQTREVLLEEYYHGYFGEAAVPMRRFFERCEQQWMHQPGRAYWLKHFRNESQAQLFPSAVCRELRALLDEAARQARGAPVRERVRIVSDAFGVTERFVAFCEAREELNREVLGRKIHEPSGDQGRGARETHEIPETRTDEGDPMAAGSALRSTQPPGVEGNRTKREARGRGASDLSTLSSQHSTASQGLVAHETHGTREADANADAVAKVSGFSSQVFAGTRYLAAREEFIGYTKALMAREPRALAPFRWEDYLRHEPPAVDSERWTVDGGRETAPEGGSAEDRSRYSLGSAPVKTQTNSVRCGLFEQEANRGRAEDELPSGDGGWKTVDSAVQSENLLRNGDLHGPLQTPRRIGGLDYGVAMPEGWTTTVEPAEGQSARVEGGVLRLERNKETFVYQWLPATPGAKYRATVQVRGRVQPSATASLTLSWLDERQAPLGFKVHRLPEGAWPEWVTLEVAQDLPMAARWIGTGVRVQHQLAGDWLEVRAVRLERVR